MFNQVLKNVVGGEYLNTDEAYHTAQMLLRQEIPEIQAAAFLGAMHTRKESPEELSGFAQALCEAAIMVEPDRDLIDTCGTGGDGLGTFNISTAAALVVAGCGVSVAKHGNRGVTGRVGSADVLEALGVRIQLTPNEARNTLDRVGITFLFAPYYHPILRQVGSLRQQIGITTIFNFLGPLVNPFRPSYQVLGVSDGRLQEAMSHALREMKRKRAMVIHADNGMDEISPTGKTRVYEINQQHQKVYSIDPEDIGIYPYQLEQIQGGTAEYNARIILEILAGKPGAYRDTVILNAAAALMTAGHARDMLEGLQSAEEAIDSGKARETLMDLIHFSQDGVIPC